MKASELLRLKADVISTGVEYEPLRNDEYYDVVFRAAVILTRVDGFNEFLNTNRAGWNAPSTSPYYQRLAEFYRSAADIAESKGD